MNKDRVGPHWEWLTSAPDWVQGEFAQEIERVESQNVELLEALEAIVQVLDGSQPKDPPGAYFIAEAAIRNANLTSS